MPRITKVYTRTGDDGSTGLAAGRRIAKDSLRVEAFGAVDELNSQIGAALAAGLDPAVAAKLVAIQNDLFHLGSDLCMLEEDKAHKPAPRIETRHVERLEAWMDEMSAELAPLENFILPGGSSGAAQLHLARAVCRRAERRVLALSRKDAVGSHVAVFLNRLSDALFVMARFDNHRRGEPDILWDSRV